MSASRRARKRRCSGLIRTASGLCEAFINQVVLSRSFECDLPASGSWERLPVTPVRSITDIASVDANGLTMPLASDAYRVDIDFAGDGWVRLAQGTGGRIRVSGTAGMADGENGVPEPIRQGVLRLVAHEGYGAIHQTRAVLRQHGLIES